MVVGFLGAHQALVAAVAEHLGETGYLMGGERAGPFVEGVRSERLDHRRRYTPRSASWSASCRTVAATRHWASAIVTARRGRGDLAPLRTWPPQRRLRGGHDERRVRPGSPSSSGGTRQAWQRFGPVSALLSWSATISASCGTMTPSVPATRILTPPCACTTRRGRPVRALDATKCLGALLCLCSRPDGVVTGAATASPRPGPCEVKRALPVGHPGLCSA
jgi:hypothetical protein